MRTEDDGLTDAERAALTAIAPLDAWDLEWQEDVKEWHTAVACPSCGAHQRYELIGLSDFRCDDCGYDWTDEDPPLKMPTPVPV
ncbi:hypothetical protein [Burkholderia lata]|uniref:hypothetical protein n=1 Tax=Burkholderia lata (strain ATCC 17760 / DSM 23089 / LMG 22485 / NCIMB 9086 / R18194 / 383) TaxID=482957 RepID=UPI00158341A6|nr:hypothetical protein [Burkholderia lata]